MSFELGLLLGLLIGLCAGLYAAAAVSNAIVDKLVERVNSSAGAQLKRESIERIRNIKRNMAVKVYEN